MHICFGKNNIHLPEDGENSLTPTLCGEEKITLNKSVSVSSVPTLTSGGTTKRTPHLCGDDKSPYLPDGGCDCSYFIEKGSDEGTFETYNLIMNGQVRGDTIYVPKRLGVTQTDYYLLTNQGDSVEDAKTLVDKTASGDIVTIDDSAGYPLKSLSVSLSPIQNLNGYDHPWVGGAGVNKFAIGDAASVGSQSSYGLTVSIDANAETIRIHGTATWNNNGAKSFRIVSTMKNGQYGDAPITHDYSGMICTPFVVNKSSNITSVDRISYDATGGTLGIIATTTADKETDITLKIAITEDTAPASWSPYENICPISGWDGVSVTRVGKNLFDWNEQAPPTVANQFTKNDGYGVLDATLTVNKQYNFSGGRKLLKAGTYTLSQFLTNPDNNVRTALYVYDKPTGGTLSTKAVRGNASTTFTISTDSWYTGAISALAAGTYNTEIRVQLEKSTTATDYEPYTGETITQEFVDAQGNTLTVYGGESEIVGGVLTVSKAAKTYNGASGESWTSTSIESLDIYIISVPDAVSITNYDNENRVISNLYAPVSANTATHTGRVANSIAVVTNTRIFVTVPSGTYASVAAFKSALSAQPLQVVYELATPITYTLTPQQVETLIGTNNIWSDAGDVTVEYVGMDEAEWTTENTVPDPYNRFVWWKYTEQYEDGSEQFESEPVVFNSYPEFAKGTKAVVTGGTKQTISVGGGGALATRESGGIFAITSSGSGSSSEVEVVTDLQTEEITAITEVTD